MMSNLITRETELVETLKKKGMETELVETLKKKGMEITGPIIISDGSGNNPCLPYQGYCVNIPKNLHPTSRYNLGCGSFTNPAASKQNIGFTLNNLIEMMTFLTLEQIPSHSNSSQENVAKHLNENLKKEIEILEQNRKDISRTLEIKDKEIGKQVETVFQNTQRISDLIIEIPSKISNNELFKKIDNLSKEILLIKEEITEIKKDHEKFGQKLIKDFKEILKPLEKQLSDSQDMWKLSDG